MLVWNILFVLILLIIWVVSGGFITETAIKLSPYTNTDASLNHAYWSAFWTAFITWLLVILIIIAIIGIIALFGSGIGEAAEAGELIESGVYRSRTVNRGISWFSVVSLIVALIFVGITGVLSAVAANNIRQSPNFNALNNDLQKAYNSAIIAACLCLGSGGLLIIGIIIYFIVSTTHTTKVKTN
jgi:hypothetical protein